MKKLRFFSDDAWKRISAAVKWVEQNKTQIIPAGGIQREEERRFSRHPLRIAITTEDISPNTYGAAKFTTGAKGSETVTGEEYQMFYRAEEVDAPDCPSGTKCFAIWIDCSDLDTAAEETGWELTPIACIDA